MSEVSNSVEKSTWASKFAALGPGIVMASGGVCGVARILAPPPKPVQFMVGN